MASRRTSRTATCRGCCLRPSGVWRDASQEGDEDGDDNEKNEESKDEAIPIERTVVFRLAMFCHSFCLLTGVFSVSVETALSSYVTDIVS
jgi:hypothetical protein